MADFAKNSIVSLEIEDLAYGGEGVAKPGGFVVLVRGAVPGDRVQARITRKKKNYAQARLVAIEQPAPHRIDPPCPLFGACGGCTWQMLPYEVQLEWKRRQVDETLRHLGGLSVPEIDPIVASPEIWNYRNKMEYSFGLDETGRTVLGFHEPGRFDRIFEVDRCLIHPEPFDALLGALTGFARENGLPGYDPRRHEGFLRHAVMRHSRTTGAVVLALITAEGSLDDPEALVRRLREACPELQGMIWGVNTGVADVAAIERERFRWGDPILEETINGLRFQISPQSFFQTNTMAAERLYRMVIEMAELGADDCVLDAFCGAGVIALHCASRASRVVGVEIVREAAWNARANARINGVANAQFIAAPVQEGLDLARHAARRPFSRVIIDPPRGGMDKKSLAMLIGIGAPVFIYVSCNPATLARDLQKFTEGGYAIEAVRPIDMFPHTYHIETVVRLRRDRENPRS